jgi:hypothetical protein
MKNTIIIILIILVINLGFQITDRQSTVDNFRIDSEQLTMLLNEDGKVAGYTCGLLTVSKAQEILNNKNIKREFGQGPATEIQDDKITDTLFWSDSCRYQSIANSNNYVEFFIATFFSNKAAEKYFDDFLPGVNEASEKESRGFGLRLIYDSGVFYLLRENKVIQVSANNSSIANKEDFSYSALTEILNSYDL